MGKKYTVQEFSQWLHRFPQRIQSAAMRAWDVQTQEVLDDAKERTPLVSGDLERSGAALNARVTRGGIVSAIVFRAPYAKDIETGERNGKKLTLKPVGYKYPHRTKARLGEFGFLSNAGAAGADGLLEALEQVIDKEWGRP